MNRKGGISKILERITINERGCWIWPGRNTGERPYGLVTHEGVSCLTHRLTYTHFKGEIPDNLFIDHLCRNTLCCNPDHLEPVTNEENIRRGASSFGKTHCPQGHELTPENTYQFNRTRACKECRNEASRRCRRKQKAEVVIGQTDRIS